MLSVMIVLLLGKIYYDTNSLEVRHYEISHPALGRVLEGLKVAHLSDLHIKEMGERENRILKILGE
jgi:predicted MPP superfamily phosphohydrolase